MDGINRFPGSRLDEWHRAHPAWQICRVEGIWHAWLPLPSGGAEAYGRDEDELLGKLAGEG